MIKLIEQWPYPPKAIKSKLHAWAYCLTDDKNWQLSQEFVDAASGLTVLLLQARRRYCLNEKGEGYSLPNKVFLLDQKPTRLLAPKDWRSRFEYKRKEWQDPKGIFLLQVERIWSETGDYYEEKLFKTENMQLLMQRQRLAFEEKEAESLLLKQLRKERSLKNKPQSLSLAQLSQLQAQKMKESPCLLLLSYVDEENKIFRLWSKYTALELKDEDGQLCQKFDSLEDFWWFWNAAGLFFLYYRPCHHCLDHIKRPLFLCQWIVQLGNQLRQSQNLNSSDYFLLQQWENLCFDPSLSSSCFKQFCPICQQALPYNPRYPKRVCKNCQAKAQNEAGQSLRFYNQGLNKGLVLETLGPKGEVLKKDQGRSQYYCYINKQLCLIHEGRLGGILLRLLD